MYFNQETIKNVMELYSNPLFKKGFFDFFLKMQREGIEAARKFSGGYFDKDLFPNAPDIFEKMADLYIILGLVPRMKYDEALKENEKLKEQNGFLRDTLRELQANIFKEGGEKMQEAWETIIEKQLEVNREVAKNFFELLRELKSA
jgi:hypothetical protein